jgi:hypothetical protein
MVTRHKLSVGASSVLERGFWAKRAGVSGSRLVGIAEHAWGAEVAAVSSICSNTFSFAFIVITNVVTQQQAKKFQAFLSG